MASLADLRIALIDAERELAEANRLATAKDGELTTLRTAKDNLERTDLPAAQTAKGTADSAFTTAKLASEAAIKALEDALTAAQNDVNTLKTTNSAATPANAATVTRALSALPANLSDLQLDVNAKQVTFVNSLAAQKTADDAVVRIQGEISTKQAEIAAAETEKTRLDREATDKRNARDAAQQAVTDKPAADNAADIAATEADISRLGASLTGDNFTPDKLRALLGLSKAHLRAWERDNTTNREQFQDNLLGFLINTAANKLDIEIESKRNGIAGTTKTKLTYDKPTKKIIIEKDSTDETIMLAFRLAAEEFGKKVDIKTSDKDLELRLLVIAEHMKNKGQLDNDFKINNVSSPGKLNLNRARRYKYLKMKAAIENQRPTNDVLTGTGPASISPAP